MQKNTVSGNAALDGFLDCVARCLAQRWLKLQSGGSQGEHPSDHLITPTSVDHASVPKGVDGKRRRSR